MADDADAAPVAAEDETNAIILDPSNSERQYYTEPFTGLQREIWRPSDGDGDRTIGYYDDQRAIPPVEKRWRFYQSRTGDGPIKATVDEPPKYVILDDRAAYEVLASKITAKSSVRYWGHDFGGSGFIRSRRPHRGRPAIGDADAPGDEKYHFAFVGQDKERYHFKGEEGYKPIIYRSAEPTIAKIDEEDELILIEDDEDEAKKRKRSTTPTEDVDEPQLKKRLCHNQHTAKSKLVKNGAPGYGKRKRVKHHIPALRHIDPANIAAASDETAKTEATKTPKSAVSYGEEVKSVLKKNKSAQPMQQSTPVSVEEELESNSDMEEFPFARRGSSALQLNTAVSEESIASVSDRLTEQRDVATSIEKDNDTGLLEVSTFKPKAKDPQPDSKRKQNKKHAEGRHFELNDLKKASGGNGANAVTLDEKIGWIDESGLGLGDQEDGDEAEANNNLKTI